MTQVIRVYDHLRRPVTLKSVAERLTLQLLLSDLSDAAGIRAPNLRYAKKY